MSNFISTSNCTLSEFHVQLFARNFIQGVDIDLLHFLYTCWRINGKKFPEKIKVNPSKTEYSTDIDFQAVFGVGIRNRMRAKCEGISETEITSCWVVIMEQVFLSCFPKGYGSRE